ncbi:xaa-Pro aminopeptidase 1-like [Planococcus citri]|uniref:xaa-Pro aminopeptidase 1-like n=1 Tax=Planococcus citri TaxID=170843 RepID=UPI0031F95A89
MRNVRISDNMLLRSFLVFWLFVVLLVNGQTISQEITRKLCPPMNMKGVTPPQNRIDTLERIQRLREAMANTSHTKAPVVDAFMITRYDEHMNDFPADFDKRLEFISGYSGNYGLAIVTKNKSAFWTDELHHFQANNELSCNWTLYRTDNLVAAAAEWVVQELGISMRLATDPKLIPNSEWEIIQRAISSVPSKSLIFVPTALNLVDVIWPENERPATPVMPVFIWDKAFAGKEWRDKLTSLRNVMKNYEVEAMLITALSEIAWLLNIRGFDLQYGPYLKAYCVVTKDQVHLYTDQQKLQAQVIKDHLGLDACSSANCVRAHDYDSLWNDLRKLSQNWRKVLLPSMSHFSPGVSRAIYLGISPGKHKVMPSPLINMIAEKNEDEKKGMRSAHQRDAMIFCNLMARIEDELQRSSESIDELRVVNITNELRLADASSRSISYPTSVASGPNTGMPLYVPNNFTNLIIERNKLLIIDAGAHYWGGTTALARTFIMDPKVTNEQYIELYTRLLMGLINLASFTFPPHLYTSQLDIIARIPLWEIGVDFPHGSGHGIGAFMNFYESPIDLNYKSASNDTLKDGYFLLAEVGYYQEDDFGMKLSMVLEVVYQNHSSGYLTFEPVTLVPFEPKLINVTMLSTQQKIWLNEYNNKIKTNVVEMLKKQNFNNGYNWASDRTDPIPLGEEDNKDAGEMIKSKYFVIVVFFILQLVLNY